MGGRRCAGVPTAERRKTALSRPITIALFDTSVPFALLHDLHSATDGLGEQEGVVGPYDLAVLGMAPARVELSVKIVYLQRPERCEEGDVCPVAVRSEIEKRRSLRADVGRGSVPGEWVAQSGGHAVDVVVVPRQDEQLAGIFG